MQEKLENVNLENEQSKEDFQKSIACRSEEFKSLVSELVTRFGEQETSLVLIDQKDSWNSEFLITV